MGRNNGRKEELGKFNGIQCSGRPLHWVMLHAARQPEGGGYSGEDGDDEVDDHLPRLFLSGFGHNSNDLETPPLSPPLQGGAGYASRDERAVVNY